MIEIERKFLVKDRSFENEAETSRTIKKEINLKIQQNVLKGCSQLKIPISNTGLFLLV